MNGLIPFSIFYFLFSICHLEEENAMRLVFNNK
jgi:hypothetical protein